MGDPDNADHVSVTTPGLGTNLRESLGSMMGEAQMLKLEAESQLRDVNKSDTVATIAWIGYDPPQKEYANLDIGNVVLQGRAESAAPVLANFYEGLDTASTKNDPHITALGHSYGSLATSLALQESGRAVDDVVFYGSPGLGEKLPPVSQLVLAPQVLGLDWNNAVKSPSDLGLSSGHVFEMSEVKDPVANANRFGLSPNRIDWIEHLDTAQLTVTDSQGNERTYTGAEGHAEYPREGDKGLLHRSGYNLAAVLAGLPENAKR